MSKRLVIRRAVHPEGSNEDDAWVIFDTVRGEICDGAYFDRESAALLAVGLNQYPAEDLWEGDSPVCLGVTGWRLADEGEVIPMARITIREFRISDRAADKFWSHGITRRQVEEILLNRLVVTLNRKDRVAEYLAIGRDNHGRCLTIPIVATDDPSVWRPITAWYCKPGEAARLR